MYKRYINIIIIIIIIVHSLLLKQQIGIPVMIKLGNYVGLKKKSIWSFFLYTFGHFTEYCLTIFMEHMQCKMS